MRPQGVSTAGQKKGIFGRVRAKTGQWHRAGLAVCDGFFTKSPGYHGAGVSPTDRCYEPSGEKSAVAIPDRGTAIQCFQKSMDHDFVIEACRRNKLKDRPN
jgi:hypothetical protein